MLHVFMNSRGVRRKCADYNVGVLVLSNLEPANKTSHSFAVLISVIR